MRAVDTVTRQGGHQARPYFGITFAWTWLMWGSAGLMGASLAEPVGSLLFMLGGLGPLVATAWLLRRADRAYRRDFLRRVWDPRRIRAPWWGALLAVAVGPAALGAVVAGAFGTTLTVPAYGIAAIGSAIAFALLAGVAEEPGWRGLASDALQRRMPSTWAALGIGAIWSLWHLPLAFIDGTYYQGLGFGSLAHGLTHLALVPLGVLYLWLANGTGGSILIAILAHAGFNVAASLAPRSPMGDLIALVAITVATVIVLLRMRRRLSDPLRLAAGGQVDNLRVLAPATQEP